MRLTFDERQVIKRVIAERFDPDARVFLFGSRVDDKRRGGDIDLYVETTLSPEEANHAKLQSIADIQRSLGEQKIDLVISPFVRENSLIRQEIDRQAVSL